MEGYGPLAVATDAAIEQLRVGLSKFFSLASGLANVSDEIVDTATAELAGRSAVFLTRRSQRPALFDYQADLVQQVLRSLENRSSGLLSLPTGGGKTRTGVVACLEGFAERIIGNLIWLAPTRELVEQAQATFLQMWREHGQCPDIQLSRGFSVPVGNAVCVTTPQEVYQRIRNHSPLGAWDAVVFDEAHQLGARTYDLAVQSLRTSGHAPDGRIAGLVGLSATPGRSDEGETENLVDLFDGRLLTSSILGANPVSTLQRRGVLARLEFRSLTQRNVEVSDEVARLRIAVKACESLAAQGRRVLVFCQSVAGAECLAEALTGIGIPSTTVSAQTPTLERLARLSAFGSGQVSVLTNQRLLATGYDCPAVSDVLILGPVGSPILFEQIVGRAARGPRTGGSSLSRVWDFDDHRSKFGLPSSYYRYRDYEWSSEG